MRTLESYYSVCPDTGCWLWNGHKNSLGYGTVSKARAGNRSRFAHRHLYELHKEKIPAGLVIDHLCRTPSCVNPDHLEAVTQKENVRRGNVPSSLVNRGGVCKKGLHAMTDENVLTCRGVRKCRTCALERAKLWQRARRAS